MSRTPLTRRLAGVGPALKAWARALSVSRGDLKGDVVAGIPGAVGSVPDGMAASVLAGVNPVHGLYASFAGPIAGGLTSSTRLMVITTTSAAALAAGSALQDFAPDERTEALFLMTLLAGVLMIVAGVLRLGRYTRFVSLSVMLGFLTGVAANIVLGQLSQLTGADAEGDVALTRALDILLHPGRIDPASLLVGALTLGLLLVLTRTKLSSYASVIALILPSLLALGLSSVATVADVGDIPTGVPLPHLPELRLLFSASVLTGAAVIAVIVLVQGAGVSEAVPNPDGTASDANGDFKAQGIANLAAGLFRGQPVGGSVGQTALNAAAGARTRWAAIFSGIWMFAILAALSGLVGKVAMPTLAAILIFAGVSSVNVADIRMVTRTGASSVVAMVTTFLATLFLPIAAAVGIGVALSLLLQLNREALDLLRGRTGATGGRRLRRAPRPDLTRGPRGDAARRLRKPLLRRRPNARRASARPARGDGARRRPALARAHGSRRHVVQDPLRLCAAARSDRRPPLPQRRVPRPARTTRARAEGGARGHRRVLRHRPGRRVQRRGVPCRDGIRPGR